MTNQDRFNKQKHPFKFTGEGKIEDNKRNLDIDAKFRFNGKIKEIDSENKTITFDLVDDEYNSLWEMVVLDGDTEDKKEENIMATYQGEFANEINGAAFKYNVDPFLIAGMIKTESDFNPIAISLAGAKGLMQLMKGTCEEVNVSDPFDPEQNIDGGVKWFSERLKEFGDVQKALAAYNCGTKTVMKYDGIPPFKETQEYVQKVLENAYSFSPMKNMELKDYFPNSHFNDKHE